MAGGAPNGDDLSSVITDLERLLGRVDDLQLTYVGLHLNSALEAAKKLLANQADDKLRKAKLTPRIG